MHQIDIVIPAFNEEENLPKVHELLLKLQPEDCEFHFIFVNDGSTDSTQDVIEEMMLDHKNISFLEFSRNFGHQAALSAGIKSSEGDATITMDADLQHPPKLVLEMIDNWKNGFEIVYTLRKYHQESTLLKRVTSTVYYQIINKLSHIHIPQGAADFRLWDKKVVNEFKRINEKGIFLRGLSSWMGFKQVAIEYTSHERFKGESKYNIRKMLLLALDGVTSFSSFPLYISSLVGFVILFIGMLWASHVFYIKYFTQESTPGWASIMILIILIGGIQIILLGIMGIYLAKIHEQIKDRPDYIIKNKRKS